MCQSPLSNPRRRARQTRPRHRLRAALVSAAGLVLILPACGAEDRITATDADCARLVAGPSSVDAFDWLKQPYGGETGFGTWDRDASLALCHELERYGVTRATAVNVKRLGEGSTAPRRAGGLVVALPEEVPRRRAVFGLHAKVVRSQGYAAVADTGQKFLLFLWAG